MLHVRDIFDSYLYYVGQINSIFCRSLLSSWRWCQAETSMSLWACNGCKYVKQQSRVIFYS